MGKPFWKSRTIMFNLLSALVAAAPVAVTMIHNLQTLGLDQQVASQILAVLSIINVIGNMYLRTVTVEPLRVK